MCEGYGSQLQIFWEPPHVVANGNLFQKNNASHSSESSQLSIHWKQAVNLIPPFSFYKSPKFHGITDIDAEPGKHCEVGEKRYFSG